MMIARGEKTLETRENARFMPSAHGDGGP